MTSKEIGTFALGMLVTLWVIDKYGYDSDAGLVVFVLAWIGVLITTGYNWGRWTQKKRMEPKDE